MYYPCSENKDADQLRGYREADLRLCFRICKKTGFLTTRLNPHLTKRYQDREIIRKAGMEMNSNPRSKYKVREQFPKEIEDRRKLLYSAMYRLKANSQNRVNMVRDKLYVNGKLYIPEEYSEYKLPSPRSTYKRPEIGSYSRNQYAGFGPNRQYAPYNGHQNTQRYSVRQAPTFGRARDIQREKLYTPSPPPPPPPYPRPDQVPNTYIRFNI